MASISVPERRSWLARHPRLAPGLVLAASVLALGTALASEYWGGLSPCILCLYQRYPYWVAIGLGVVGLALADRPAALRVVVGLAGLAFLTSAGIGAFHVGVEQGWWQGTDACAGTIPTGLSVEELAAQLMATPVARCDQVAWSFAGVSMAGFNFLYAAACGVAALWAALAMRAPARRT